MPVSLLKKLEKKDKVKAYKKEYGQKKEIKRKRMEKVNKQIKRGIEENKLAIAQGKDYKSGIAIQAEKTAQKTVRQLMAAEQKKTSTLPLSKRTCRFYPQYCKVKGHADVRCKDCGMHNATKAEREAALKDIESSKIMEEAARVGVLLKGKYKCVLVSMYTCIQPNSFFFTNLSTTTVCKNRFEWIVV